MLTICRSHNTVGEITVASFPGPAQLLVACSTEKRGELLILSHVSNVINNWQKSRVSHIVQPTTSSTLVVYNSHLSQARYVW